MDVSVFVSSTCRDMAQDCRPAVLRAIRMADEILKDANDGRAAAVAMEDWDADFEPALEFCLEMIRGHSTHYVGVLGYLRGFMPADAGSTSMSLTEAELGCAVEHCGRRCVAIFVPKEHSPIALELRRRAAALQTAAELETQMAFHARVLHDGTAQHFEDVADLNGRVIRKVVFWAKGGIRQQARASSQVATATTVSRRSPGSSEINQLGRREQLTAFTAALERLSLPRSRNAAAFLVGGSRGFGHRQLMDRLANVVRGSAFAAASCYMVSAGAVWRENGVASLLRTVGQEIRAGWRPEQISELAAELASQLDVRDVIVQVAGVEGFTGGPAAFLADFWTLLAASLPASAPNRLICLASVETGDESMDAFAAGGPMARDETCPGWTVALPRLQLFTEPELSFWLKSRLPARQAAYWSQKLMARTRGLPDAVYAFLADPALWEQ